MPGSTTSPWMRLGVIAALVFGVLHAADLAPLPPIGIPSLQGVASWYGEIHEGRLTASGTIFRRHELTAAHRTAPFGTRYLVVYRDRVVHVTITDRGPYVLKKGRYTRDLDLSEAAARALGLIATGVAPVHFREIHNPLAKRLDLGRLLPRLPATLAAFEGDRVVQLTATP